MLDTARFFIKAGTELSVKTVVEHSQWKRHVTKRDLGFERFETYHSGAYQFRELGWMILVKSYKVQKRK